MFLCYTCCLTPSCCLIPSLNIGKIMILERGLGYGSKKIVFCNSISKICCNGFIEKMANCFLVVTFSFLKNFKFCQNKSTLLYNFAFIRIFVWWIFKFFGSPTSKSQNSLLFQIWNYEGILYDTNAKLSKDFSGRALYENFRNSIFKRIVGYI